MKKSTSCVTALAHLLLSTALFFYGGCTTTMSDSNFLRRFSLQATAARVVWPAIYWPPSGGGDFDVAGSFSGPGHIKPSVHLSTSVTCLIQEKDHQRFDEDGFLKAILAELEKEITTSGAVIDQKDIPGLQLNYSDPKLTGELKLSGTRQGGRYKLTAIIDEKAK